MVLHELFHDKFWRRDVLVSIWGFTVTWIVLGAAQLQFSIHHDRVRVSCPIVACADPIQQFMENRLSWNHVLGEESILHFHVFSDGKGVEFAGLVELRILFTERIGYCCAKFAVLYYRQQSSLQISGLL